MKLSRILIVVAIIVVLFFFIRYIVALNYNTLSTLNDATSSVLIPATSMTTDVDGSSATSFTYSIWFYVKDWSYRYGTNKVIFTRSLSGASTGSFDDSYMSVTSCGAITTPSTGGWGGCILGENVGLITKKTGDYERKGCELSTDGCCPFSNVPRSDNIGTNCKIPGGALDPCPTMYLGATENDLFYQLSVPDPTKTGPLLLYTTGVKNVPIQRWVHSVLCVYDRTVEIYIDGKLARTSVMPNVITNISETAEIYLSPGTSASENVGFSGYTSNLKYYPHPITPVEVWNLYRGGPGTGISNSFGGSDYSVEVNLYDGNMVKNSYTIGGNNSRTTSIT
jgi:hypothetical protein